MSTAAISSPPLLRLRPLDSARDQRSSYRLSLKGNNLGFSLKTAAPMTKKFELNCSAVMDRDLSTAPLAEGTADFLDDFPPAELELKRRETSIATVLTNIGDSFDPYGAMMYSPMYYAASTASGIASCGLTHMAKTPLDVVKCNMQIDPAKYKSTSLGFGVLLKEQGVRGLFRGWVPTLLGYSAQGACKYGFYEFFKKYYSDIAGPEYAAKYKTLIYLARSASAEALNDGLKL